MEGDPLVGNRPLRNGIVKRYVVRDGKKIYWQLYWVQSWTSKWCWRCNLGWKLWNPIPESGELNCQYVISVNPCMGYE